MGWKPGDPPQRAGGRRRPSAPEPPDNVTPIEDAPSAPRRRRRRPVLDSSASVNEKRLAGGSGVEPGKRGTGQARREQKRVRLGERWSEIVTAVQAGEYTWREFVESLDDDEVARCQLKDANGGFTGRPPSYVPREFALAAARELKHRFEQIFKDEVVGIARAYVELAQDADLPAKDKLKAMQYAMERIFGSIPKEVFISQEAPWESVVTQVVANEEQNGPPVDRYAGREQATDN